jgi:hypothetical protein
MLRTGVRPSGEITPNMKAISTTQAASPAPWAGWHRMNSRDAWKKVCEASSSREAWAKLFDLRQGGDKCVTPANRTPDSGKRPRPGGDLFSGE